jgi:hypothetical protein
MIPLASTEISEKINDLIIQAANSWKKENSKNLFHKHTLNHWVALVDEWSENVSMPLIVRNSRKTRGGITKHISGREIIFCDNSPAKWVAEKVFLKETPSLQEIRLYLKRDKVPFKFAPAKGEQELAKYKCISNNDLNKAGWKLCHIERVGLRNQKDIENQSLDLLKEKFKLLLNPKNFFILPKSIGGLGEIQAFIQVQK